MPYPVASVRNRNFGVATPFTGAYDAIPNIVVAYGMRRLRTAYTGSILRIRRSSDNAEQDIGYTAAGDLDTAAIASFIGGGSGYFVKWYDQSGNANDASQTTAASQPLYVASGQNGKPVGRFDGVDDVLDHTFNNLSQPVSVVAVAKRSGGSGIWQTIIQAGNPLISARTGASINWGAYLNADIPSSYSIDGVFGVLSLVIRSGIDFDEVTNGVVETKIGSGYYYEVIRKGIGGLYTGGGEYLTGDIAELLICNAALSDANRQAAETAANAYWAVY